MPLSEKGCKRMHEYVVYKHTNLTNGKVYIGITCQDVKRRWQNGHGYAGTYFWNAIQKYGWDGFAHEVVFEGLTKSEACNEEKRLISIYRSQDREFGYNIAEGGQTGDNLQPMFGKDNYRAVSVRRINPKTGEVKIYTSIADAVKEMGINYRGISKACRGDSKTYMGYVWEYEDIPFDKPIRPTRGKYEHVKQKKAVLLIDVDSKVYRFDSIKAAGESLGIRPNTIARYLQGIRKDATGRRWSYCL